MTTKTTDTNKGERVAGAWAPIGILRRDCDFHWHRPGGQHGNAVEVWRDIPWGSAHIAIELASGQRQHVTQRFASARHALIGADVFAKAAGWMITGAVPDGAAFPDETPISATAPPKDDAARATCVVTPAQIAKYADHERWGVARHNANCSRVSGPVPLSAFVDVETGCCGECGMRVAPPQRIASRWVYSATPKPTWIRKTNKGDVLAAATHVDSSGYAFTCCADGANVRTGLTRRTWVEALEDADWILFSAGWILADGCPDEVRWAVAAWERDPSLSGLEGPRWVRRTRGRGTHGLCVEVTPRRDGAEGFVFHFPDPRHVQAFSTLGEALRAADEVAAGRGWTLTGGLPAEFESATTTTPAERPVIDGWAQTTPRGVCDFEWTRSDHHGGIAAEVSKVKGSVVFGVRVRTKSDSWVRPPDTFASLEKACRAADKLAQDLGWELRGNGLLDYIASPPPEQTAPTIADAREARGNGPEDAGCHGCMDGGKSEHATTCPTRNVEWDTPSSVVDAIASLKSADAKEPATKSAGPWTFDVVARSWFRKSGGVPCASVPVDRDGAVRQRRPDGTPALTVAEAMHEEDERLRADEWTWEGSIPLVVTDKRVNGIIEDVTPMAGPWKRVSRYPDVEHWARPCRISGRREYHLVEVSRTDLGFDAIMWTHTWTVIAKSAQTLADAMRAADTEIVRRGWVLSSAIPAEALAVAPHKTKDVPADDGPSDDLLFDAYNDACRHKNPVMGEVLGIRAVCMPLIERAIAVERERRRWVGRRG